MARLIADAGLLIKADRNDRDAWALKRAAAEDDVEIVVPAPVLAQSWRGARSVNLARYLVGLEVAAFTEELARRAGELLRVAGTSDVCDAAVVVTARDGDRVVTEDVNDVTHLIERQGLRVEVLRI
ncbi:MAG: twitching motility protein PilT [Actinomycetota bacterium]